MHPSREVASVGKSLFQRTSRRGRALQGYRRLGIEQLEDRRVLSGISPFAAPAPILYGPIQSPVTASPMQSAIRLSCHLARTACGRDGGRPVDQCLRRVPLQPDPEPTGRERQPLPFPG